MRVFHYAYQLTQKVTCKGLLARPAIWISVDNGRSRQNFGWHHRMATCQILHFSSYSSLLSSTTKTMLPWESSFCVNPMKKLEASLEENCVDEAWEDFCNYKRLHGFPDKLLVKKMVSLMTKPLNSYWLIRAYKLVLEIFHKRPVLLDCDSMTRLGLILARSQMPIPASTAIRIALNRFKFPEFDILNSIFLHLVKSDIGSDLASNILIEICELVLHQKPNSRNSLQLALLNKNVILFNLVLNSCSKYQFLQKSLLIMKFMSQIGVVGDANSIIIIAQIYEKLGQRAELMGLKVHVDNVASVTFCHHYCHFYDSLLSLHFSYNDLDAAKELMLDLYSQSRSFHCVDDPNALNVGLRKPCMLQIGSGNLTVGYKIAIEPDKLGSGFIMDSEVQSRFVLFSDGKFVPSSEALVKLINGFAKEGRIGEVSNFLINVEKKINSIERNFSTVVLAVFIQLGWLETAHDVLDDLESAGISVDSNVYKSLFQAYRKGNHLGESEVLLKQMRKLGLYVNLSNKDGALSCLSGECAINPNERKVDLSEKVLCLAEHLNKEIKQEDLVIPLVYEFNSTVLFFCEANMMEDAIRTVKRMQLKNIQPTAQTFSYLLNGYSSLKMYRQITILWGEMKRRLEDGVLSVNWNLLDCLLINFLRGGYFERVMDIANYMTRHKIFADKWKYKVEFLKHHKNLYMNLKAVDAKTAVQRKRLEQVQAFKEWANAVKSSK